MKKILILGSNGYIGSALSERLISNKKYSINGVDTCWFNTQNIYTHFVTDFKNLTKQFIQTHDVVILLAGHSSVKMCEGNLKHSHKNNVENFIQLLDKLNENTKFIYASSSSVYGKCNSVADENYTDFTPYNNYDITKHVIDLYVQRFNIEYYGLRFGTVNGYSPIVRSDVMINSMYSNAKLNNEIKLYIKHINRPILGMSDLIKSIECIIECEKDYRGVYNLASFNKTAAEIAFLVSKELNVKVIESELESNEETLNSKLQTICYDFKISTTKFEKTFNFEFTDTVETIVNSLKNNKFIETLRNKNITYE